MFLAVGIHLNAGRVDGIALPGSVLLDRLGTSLCVSQPTCQVPNDGHLCQIVYVTRVVSGFVRVRSQITSSKSWVLLPSMIELTTSTFVSKELQKIPNMEPLKKACLRRTEVAFLFSGFLVLFEHGWDS